MSACRGGPCAHPPSLAARNARHRADVAGHCPGGDGLVCVHIVTEDRWRRAGIEPLQIQLPDAPGCYRMLQKNQTKNLAVRICVEALRTGIRHLIDQLLGRAQEGTQEQQISDIAIFISPDVTQFLKLGGGKTYVLLTSFSRSVT